MDQKRTNQSLGILSVGTGSVASTLFAGVEMARRGIHYPIGSITQVDSFPTPEITGQTLAEQLGLVRLDAIHFGGFDILETNAFEAAERARVLTRDDLEAAEKFLRSVEMFPGIYRERFLPSLSPTHSLSGSLKEQVTAVRGLMKRFIESNKCDSTVLVLCHSTEAFFREESGPSTVAKFEAAIESEHVSLSPSQLYAYAALQEGISVVNATPNPVLSIPALRELAESRHLSLAGSDLKSGQTYMKTVIASAIRERMLGVHGWFSTNILGNRDGQVLNNPQNFRAKEHTKKSVLDTVFPAAEFPHHYSDLEHQVHIHYYPPKGDEKEAWDSIQLFGWMGYGMELKVNYQCRDSILAAPMILDIVLLLEFAQRSGEYGVVEWLSCFFKYPSAADGSRLGRSHMDQHLMLHRRIAAGQSNPAGNYLDCR